MTLEDELDLLDWKDLLRDIIEPIANWNGESLDDLPSGNPELLDRYGRERLRASVPKTYLGMIQGAEELDSNNSLVFKRAMEIIAIDKKGNAIVKHSRLLQFQSTSVVDGSKLLLFSNDDGSKYQTMERAEALRFADSLRFAYMTQKRADPAKIELAMAQARVELSRSKSNGSIDAIDRYYSGTGDRAGILIGSWADVHSDDVIFVRAYRQVRKIEMYAMTQSYPESANEFLVKNKFIDIPSEVSRKIADILAQGQPRKATQANTLEMEWKRLKENLKSVTESIKVVEASGMLLDPRDRQDMIEAQQKLNKFMAKNSQQLEKAIQPTETAPQPALHHCTVPTIKPT